MKGMDAQEYADRFGLYLRKESDGRVYGYLKIPGKNAYGWYSSDGIYYRVPPSVILPDGLWEKTIIDPRPDASELNEGQPIIVWRDAFNKQRRYFARAENNVVWVYDSGGTKWSSKNSISDYPHWRLPTAEELQA
jgi:hypothetical protein